MAHAPARQAGGGGARIADFWRISAVFDPILEGTRRFFTGSASGAITGNSGQPVGGSLPAADAICQPDHGQPVHGWRGTVGGARGTGHGARLPVGGSWPADHGSRITASRSRGTVHGLVCLRQRARGTARLH